MVATSVVDRAPERLAQLVYLDAFVPRDGQCLFDLLAAETHAHMREAARTVGDGWRVPPIPLPPDTGAEDVAWIMPRRGMQPLRTLEQPVHLTGAGDLLPKAYIYCLRPAPEDFFWPFAERARTEQGWHYCEIDASHSPHITAPESLAALLDNLAARPLAA
jgi:hypothetical protein